MHDLPEELTGDLVLTVVVDIDGLDGDVLVMEEHAHHNDLMDRIVRDDEAVTVLELVFNEVWCVADDKSLIDIVLVSVLHPAAECLEAACEIDELSIDPEVCVVWDDLSWHVCPFLVREKPIPQVNGV